jgi:hypothetical protein
MTREEIRAIIQDLEAVTIGQGAGREHKVAARALTLLRWVIAADEQVMDMVDEVFIAIDRERKAVKS